MDKVELNFGNGEIIRCIPELIPLFQNVHQRIELDKRI